jgi:hypothetical protein
MWWGLTELNLFLVVGPRGGSQLRVGLGAVRHGLVRAAKEWPHLPRDGIEGPQLDRRLASRGMDLSSQVLGHAEADVVLEAREAWEGVRCAAQRRLQHTAPAAAAVDEEGEVGGGHERFKRGLGCSVRPVKPQRRPDQEREREREREMDER